MVGTLQYTTKGEPGGGCGNWSMKTVEAVKPIIRILGSLYKCKRTLPIPESVIDFATFSVANVPPKYAHNNNSHQIPTTYICIIQITKAFFGL